MTELTYNDLFRWRINGQSKTYDHIPTWDELYPANDEECNQLSWWLAFLP